VLLVLSMSRSLQPPRLKDWRKGATQVGLFIRTKEGSIIEAVSNNASDAASKAAAELFAQLIEKRQEPEGIMDEVKDVEVWLTEFQAKHPAIFVDLTEEETEAVCAWLADVQNQAIRADRELRKKIPLSISKGEPAFPPLTHVGGAMLDSPKKE
jgi:hypothetical protein